jgi:putative restriction endonuclease
MTKPLSAIAATRLEKAAADNGFDLERPAVGDWLSFASSQCPLRIWLTVLGDGYCLVGVSQHNVFEALADDASAFESPAPPEAAGVRGIGTFAALDKLVRRAFRLSKTLPNELLHRFEKATVGMPMATETERLVRQRVGQGLFREGLMDLWRGRCAITGVAVPELLRASHIKPWADCVTDAERLDAYNGLLLAAHLDAAFDKGLMTVADDGNVVFSDKLPLEAREALGWSAPLKVTGLTAAHRPWLEWHRARVFQKEP